MGVNFSGKEYSELVSEIMARKLVAMPYYTETSENDIGIFTLKTLAMIGDVDSYYRDRIGCESYLELCTERPSAVQLANLISYTPAEASGARVDVKFTLSSNPAGTTIPKGDQVSTDDEVEEDARIWETLSDLVIPAPTLVGTVSCECGESTTESFTGDGLPLLVCRLVTYPAIYSSIELTVGGTPWTKVSHFEGQGDTATIYKVIIHDDGVADVLFGDGVNGAIPGAGAAILITVRKGGGAGHAIDAGKITTYKGSLGNVDSVTNSAAANDGVEKESLLSIKVKAPASLKTVDRAVHLDDFAALACKVAGVGQARAWEYAGFVNVAIVPAAGGYPTADLKYAVYTYLRDRKMLGMKVIVVDPNYIAIDIVAALTVEDWAKTTETKTLAEAALTEYLNPGRQDNEGVYMQGFDEDVYLAEVYDLVMSLSGPGGKSLVKNCTVSTLKKSTQASGCGDITIAALEIRTAGTVTVTATGGRSHVIYAGEDPGQVSL